MSVTAFNRRRRELKKKLEESEKKDVVEEFSIDLNKLKVDELKAMAKDKGLEGYSSMTKTELVKLIESV